MKARLTVEYLDPLPDGTIPAPFTAEVTRAAWEERRDVHTLYNRDGTIRCLAPSRTSYVTITGAIEVPLEAHHYEYPGHGTDGSGSLGATGRGADTGSGGAATPQVPRG